MSKVTQMKKLKKLKQALVGQPIPELSEKDINKKKEDILQEEKELLLRQACLQKAQDLVLGSPENWTKINSSNKEAVEWLKSCFEDTMKKGVSFEESDFAIIDSILYNNGWCTYEESGGILLFTAKNQITSAKIEKTVEPPVFCIADYGYSVMSSNNSREFKYRVVSLYEAIEELADMLFTVETFEYWPCH